MSKLWSNKNLLGCCNREILVWRHRMDHCSFKYLLRQSMKGIISRKLSNIGKFRPCVAWLFGKFHKRPWRTKGKHSGGSIRKTSDTRPGATTAIDHMVSAQPGIISQVTRDLTHMKFWAATIFVDHYSYYRYTKLIRLNLDEKTFWANEADEHLAVTHMAGVSIYRVGK